VNIDEIYESPKSIRKAVEDLHWENATISSMLMGYEDHGILTISIGFKGESWGQGFGGRMLTSGDAFRNFAEGVLQLAQLNGAEGTMLRVGRQGNEGWSGAIVAIRPILKAWPVFWPGGDENRFYVFDSQGEVKKRGRS